MRSDANSSANAALQASAAESDALWVEMNAMLPFFSAIINQHSVVFSRAHASTAASSVASAILGVDVSVNSSTPRGHPARMRTDMARRSYSLNRKAQFDESSHISSGDSTPRTPPSQSRPSRTRSLSERRAGSYFGLDDEDDHRVVSQPRPVSAARSATLSTPHTQSKRINIGTIAVALSIASSG